MAVFRCDDQDEAERGADPEVTKTRRQETTDGESGGVQGNRSAQQCGGGGQRSGRNAAGQRCCAPCDRASAAGGFLPAGTQGDILGHDGPVSPAASDRPGDDAFRAGPPGNAGRCGRKCLPDENPEQRADIRQRQGVYRHRAGKEHDAEADPGMPENLRGMFYPADAGGNHSVIRGKGNI